MFVLEEGAELLASGEFYGGAPDPSSTVFTWSLVVDYIPGGHHQQGEEVVQSGPSPTYVVALADVGRRIMCTVQPVNTHGLVGQACSTVTEATVAPCRPSFTSGYIKCTTVVATAVSGACASSRVGS